MRMNDYRLGFVWPGGGSEQDYYQFLEAAGDNTKLFLTCTRVGGSGDDDHDVEALQRTAQISWLCEAAVRLVCLNLDAIFWPCTSGSFIGGRKHAEDQVQALNELTGVPAGSTSLAFALALNRAQIDHVSVLATYPEPASNAFVKFLSEFGITVEEMKWLDAPSGWDAAVMSPEFIKEKIQTVLDNDAPVVLVPDTALPTLMYVQELEDIAERPVLTANAVTMWNAMELTAGQFSVEGFGSLLSGELLGEKPPIDSNVPEVALNENL